MKKIETIVRITCSMGRICSKEQVILPDDEAASAIAAGAAFLVEDIPDDVQEVSGECQQASAEQLPISEAASEEKPIQKPRPPAKGKHSKAR